ncbi:MAG: PilZ domain-containing protein, partial [Terriglobia bacterium]
MSLVTESREEMSRAARRSDRIALGLRVRVSGSSGIGKEFTTTTRTTHLSRHGAKILLEHELVPSEGLNIGCMDTHREADARLVGFMGEEREGPAYGIEFLDPDVNLWD